MNSKTSHKQMNGTFNVHFVLTKLTNIPSPTYNCQVGARHEYRINGLNTVIPGILAVQPLHNCVTLLNAQTVLINDKYVYLNSINKVDYTNKDNIYYNRSVFTLKRINLLTEMAKVVLEKLIKTTTWDRHTWDRKCECKLVEPLLTITEEGLDEMIKCELTITDIDNYA